MSCRILTLIRLPQGGGGSMVKTKIIKAVFLNILFLFILSLSGIVAGGAFADVIIDNGDTGTSFTGTWSVSGASDPLWSKFAL
jgi:hypothetical protein